MNNESELLLEYANNRDEAAFTEVVRRNIDFVYSAAVRQVNGDHHLARDVSQTVFTDLARKASAAARCRTLAGWLFTSTRYAASKAVRTEHRRRLREQAAESMNEQTRRDAGDNIDWAPVQPLLDDALASLNRRDREAILLRFFEGRDYAVVGERLKLSANAARMRVDRAIDKLRTTLARRGVTSTATALTAVLSTHAVTAAPAGLAVAVSGVATTAASFAGPAFLGAVLLTKIPLGAAAFVAIAAVGLHELHRCEKQALLNEIAAIAQEKRTLASLDNARSRLSRDSEELVRPRRDDLAFAGLEEETALLKRQLLGLTLSRAPIGEARTLAAGNVYETAQLDDPPTPTSQKPPTYPRRMRENELGGKVNLVFVVDAHGNVGDVEVVDFTHEDFVNAAVEGIRQWRFRPGRLAGQPVASRVRLPMVFQLGGPNALPARSWF